MILLLHVDDCKHVLGVTDEGRTDLQVDTLRRNLNPVDQFLAIHVHDHKSVVQAGEGYIWPIDAECTDHLLPVHEVVDVDWLILRKRCSGF